MGSTACARRDMEDYIDFFDYVFGRTDRKLDNRLLYDYSFERWCKLSREQIDPQDYPAKGLDDMEIDAATIRKIATVADWERKRADVKRKLRSALGDEPPGVTNPGPKRFRAGGAGENSFGSFLERPPATKTMGRAAIAPYDGFGDQLFAIPLLSDQRTGNSPKRQDAGGHLPARARLLEGLQLVSSGRGPVSEHRGRRLRRLRIRHAGLRQSNRGGNAVLRPLSPLVENGQADCRVCAARSKRYVQHGGHRSGNRIFVAGYSLGATVGLYASVLPSTMDRRRHFRRRLYAHAVGAPRRRASRESGPIRTCTACWLRLGFFVGNEAGESSRLSRGHGVHRPRPVLVVARPWTKTPSQATCDVASTRLKKIYRLYGRDRSSLSYPLPTTTAGSRPKCGRRRTNGWQWTERRKAASSGGKERGKGGQVRLPRFEPGSRFLCRSNRT